MNDWMLELTTSGGFTGRGAGRIAFDGSEAPEAVALAVRRAEPGRWKRDYATSSAAVDRIRYRLSLVVRGARYTASWTDGDEAALPDDLASLFEAVTQYG